VRFWLSLVVAVLLNLSPHPALAEPDVNGLIGRGEPCQRLQASGGFQAFVKLNPQVQSLASDVQLAIYLDRGRLAWAQLLPMLGEVINLPVLDEGSNSEEGAPQSGLTLMLPSRVSSAADEQLSTMSLPANNRLSYLIDLADAEVAYRRGDDAEALHSLGQALGGFPSRQGRPDAGLVGAYQLEALIRYGQNDYQSADFWADKALAVIKAHPERARPLATAKVTLLLIKASSARAIAEDLGSDPLAARFAANGARYAAEAEVARRPLMMALQSPYSEWRALIPGFEPIIEYDANQRVQHPQRYADTPAEPVRELIGFINSALPSTTTEQPDADALHPTSVRALKAVELVCRSAVAADMEVGDFTAATIASRAVIAPFNEETVVDLFKSMVDDDEDDSKAGGQSDGAKDGDEKASNDPNFLTGMSDETNYFFKMTLVPLVFANDDVPAIANKVDSIVSARVAGDIAAYLERRISKDHDDTDDDDRAKFAQFMKHKSEYWVALTHLKSVILPLARPVTPSDVDRIHSADSWFVTNGEAAWRDLLGDFKASAAANAANKTVSSAQDATTAKLINVYVLAEIDAIGWGAAQSVSNKAAARDFEQRVFERYREYLTSYDAKTLQRVLPQLNALSAGTGSPSDRVLEDLDPLLSGFVSSVAVSLQQAEESAGNAEDKTNARPLTNDLNIVQSLVIGPVIASIAARENRWDRVAAIWSPVVDDTRQNLAEAKREQGDEDENSWAVAVNPNLAKSGYMQILDGQLANYIQALQNTGKIDKINQLADMVVPGLRKVEALPGDEGDKARDAVSAVLPDLSLATATTVLMKAGRTDDAYLLTKVRMRRIRLELRNTQNRLDPKRFGLDVSADRPAFEDLVWVGSHRLSGPDSQATWDDMLGAIDSSHADAAGDLIFERGLASRAGSAASQALVDLEDAQIEYQWALDADSRRYNVLLEHVHTSGNLPFGHGHQDLAKAAGAVTSARERYRRALGGQASDFAGDGLRLATLQSRMRPHELLLATMQLGEQIVIFAIPQSGVPTLAVSPASAEQVRKWAIAAKSALQLPNGYGRFGLGRFDDSALSKLYAALITPVETQVLAADAIIWSPDSLLADIPPGLLEGPKLLSVAGEVGTPWLGLARPISVAPKIDAFIQLRASVEPPPALASSLAVGDIGFRGLGGAGKGLQLDSADAVIVLDLPATPAAAADLQTFKTLTGGTTLTHEEATLAGLMARPSAKIDFLMFHTHGASSYASTGQGLVLSPPAGQTGLGGSVLGPYEVLNLPLRPRFVFLAACATGAREAASMEPYGGLVSSFFGIGAQAVLTSQNSVDDAASGHLVQLTTQAMISGRSPADALRRSQRQLQQMSEFSDPRLWGQLVWVGDANTP
jgi:CHAT domain-containing protein